MERNAKKIKKILVTDNIKKTARKLKRWVFIKNKKEKNQSISEETFQKLGFKVETLEFENNIISYLDRENNTVFVEKNMDSKEKNFTLGIQLGSLLWNDQELLDKTKRNWKDYEQEQFAYEYLMPEMSFIKSYIMTKNEKTLSNKYNVPTERIKVRIRQLGLK